MSTYIDLQDARHFNANFTFVSCKRSLEPSPFRTIIISSPASSDPMEVFDRWTPYCGLGGGCSLTACIFWLSDDRPIDAEPLLMKLL
jgi:hypothetical protein